MNLFKPQDLDAWRDKEYKGYTGRNPKTGEPFHVRPKRLPFFKCGKELKERVDYKQSTKTTEQTRPSPKITEQRKTVDQAVRPVTDMEGKYLTFTLGNEEYGISILKIREIPPKADRSPLFPRHRNT